MSLLESTPATAELAEEIHAKLQNAPSPLKFDEVKKGLPKPRKVKAEDFKK